MKFKPVYLAVIGAAALVILAIAVPTLLLRGGDEPSSSANSGNPHSPEELERFSKPIDYSPQIQAYTDMINANPQDVVAMRGLGDVYMDSARFSEAASWYQKAADAAPNEAIYHGLAGEAYYQMGMIDVSLRELQKGLEMDPNSQPILIVQGLVYAQSGKNDQAKQNWQKAYDVNPSTRLGKMAQQLLEGKDLTQGQ